MTIVAKSELASEKFQVETYSPSPCGSN